jgi:DNA (cytosine-5)-methyltransferase 3A
MNNNIGNVLSLFDGLSCGQLALEKAGFTYNNYYASEIKSHAIAVTQHNFPNTIQMGDVTKLTGEDFSEPISLLIGGSPCQDLTIMGKNRNGLEGDKSILFFEYVRLLNELKPKYFLLENVASMKNVDREIITETLGVEPILINSKLLSAQHRRRYYWTNIPVDGLPDDLGISLNDIIDRNAVPEEHMSEKKMAFINNKKDGTMWVRLDGEKSMPITARGYAAWNTQFVTNTDGLIRDLTLSEYKALQTIPEWYEFPILKSKATDLIGDGWTVDVIAYLLQGMDF